MSGPRSDNLDREAALIEAYVRGSATVEELEELAALVGGRGRRPRRVATRLVNEALIEGWLNAEADPDFVDETRVATEMKLEAPEFVASTMTRLKAKATPRRPSSSRVTPAGGRRMWSRKAVYASLAAACLLIALALGSVLVIGDKAESPDVAGSPDRYDAESEVQWPSIVSENRDAQQSSTRAGNNEPGTGERNLMEAPSVKRASARKQPQSGGRARRHASTTKRGASGKRRIASKSKPPQSSSSSIKKGPKPHQERAQAPTKKTPDDTSYLSSPPKRKLSKFPKQPAFKPLRGTAPVTLFNSAGKAIGEWARVAAYQKEPGEKHRVEFAHAYKRPVVIMQPLSYNGGHPANARILRVDEKGIDWRISEWEHGDGSHASEHVSYLVVEAGFHAIEGGARLEAGRVPITHRWRGILLRGGFTIPPVVLSQAQTANDDATVITRQMQPGRAGFLVRLQEEEANDDLHPPETVGWIAFGPVRGSTSGKRYEVGRMREPISHEWRALRFARPFGAPPVFLAGVQTFNGKDPVSLRYRNLTTEEVEVFLEEETSKDGESTHTPERVGYFLLEVGKPGTQESGKSQKP